MELERVGMVGLRHIRMAQPMPSWFGFLKIEADLAMMFIDVAIRASTSSNHGKSARNCLHARKALAEIQKGLAKPARHGLSEEQVIYLEQRRAEIEVGECPVDRRK